MKTAELEIVMTGESCVRYRLLVAGKRVWSNRVEPSEAGHAGARARMAAWALKAGIQVVEAQPAREPARAIAAGRYGRS